MLLFLISDNGKKIYLGSCINSWIIRAFSELLDTKCKIHSTRPRPKVKDGQLVQNAENLTIIPSSDINKDTEIIFVSCHFDPENISKDDIMKLMDKDGEYRDIKVRLLDDHISSLSSINKAPMISKLEINDILRNH